MPAPSPPPSPPSLLPFFSFFSLNSPFFSTTRSHHKKQHLSTPPPYTISPLLLPPTICYYPFCTTRRQQSLISLASILPIHLPPATSPLTAAALPPQPTTGLSNRHRPSPIFSPSFILFHRPNAITHNLPAATTNSPLFSPNPKSFLYTPPSSAINNPYNPISPLFLQPPFNHHSTTGFSSRKHHKRAFCFLLHPFCPLYPAGLPLNRYFS